ncbi:MAG: amidohydrolase family protein [Lentisphaeria bacterium]|nr:amidohydrolase family protein [Lentisphaeria bacterium]
MKFADAHVHIGFFPCEAKKGKLYYYSPEEVFQSLYDAKIGEFIFSSTDAVFFTEHQSFVQDEIRKMLLISNGRGHAFCWITNEMAEHDPDFTFLDALPYAGIKLHPRESDWSKNPSGLNKIFCVAKQKSFPIMFHADDDFPPDLYTDFLQAYPDVKVCMAHARPVETIVRVMEKFRQVYTDISFAPMENVSKLFMNRELLPRVMFGSDLPAPQRFFDQDMSSYLKKILEDLSVFYLPPYRDVFCKNMKRFLQK